jgi:hypothetical protein
MPPVNFIDALCDGRVLFSIAVHAALATLEPFIEFWIERRFHDNPPALWLREHVGLPLLRAACVVLFVYLAYPALFGLREAPSLTTLLAAHESGTSTVLGVAFLVALAAPVVPLFHRHPEFVLPLQGMLATAFLFDWLTGYLHITAASAWPGFDVILLMGVTAWLMHRLAHHAGRLVGAQADAATGSSGYEALIVHVFTLLAQLPVILIYSTALAGQIAI